MPDFASLFTYPNFFIIPAALIAIILHEIGHGYIAYRLGDNTAREQGRLSLNPIKHIDPLGLLLLILVGFGWAKPVQVDMRYFKKPKTGMALTALAGPSVNFIIAIISLFLLSISIYLPLSIAQYFVDFFQILAQINIGLGVFNLIPLPPLDGSKILLSFLPDAWYYQILRFEQYGMIVLFAIMFFGWLRAPIVYLITLFSNVITQVAFFPGRLFGWFPL